MRSGDTTRSYRSQSTGGIENVIGEEGKKSRVQESNAQTDALRVNHVGHPPRWWMGYQAWTEKDELTGVGYNTIPGAHHWSITVFHFSTNQLEEVSAIVYVFHSSDLLINLDRA